METESLLIFALFLFGVLGAWTFRNVLGNITINKGKIEVSSMSSQFSLSVIFGAIGSAMLLASLGEKNFLTIFYALLPALSVIIYSLLGFLTYKFDRDNYSADYEVNYNAV